MAKQPRNPRAQTPVTRHPLFPAIVALWFGALFGLGSLAIRPGLIESAVLAIGIDTIVPAAAPPLGVTARILIALALAALGGVLGATVARRIAEPRREQPTGESLVERVRLRTRDKHPDAPARRPLSVPDEISAAPLDGPGPAAAFPGRRRALAIAEDAPQFRAHEYAPLPGCAAQGTAEPAWSAATEEVALEPAPLELGAFAAPLEPEPESIALVDELPRQTFRPLAELAPAPFAEPAFEPQSVAPAPEPQFAAPTPEPLFAAPVAELAAASLFAAPPAPPLEFARFGAADPAPFPPPQSAVAAVAASAPAPALDGLDLTALTERFAASLRRRREQLGEAPAASETPRGETPSFAAPAEPETPVPEISAEPEQPVVAAAPLPMPAAFRPIGFDADDDDVAELESLAPLRQFRMPVAEALAVEPELAPEPEQVAALQAAADEDAEPESEIESGYSSLLELGRPPAQRQSFVRIDEPDADHAAIEPVVIFPGQAARLAPAAPAPLAVPQPFAAPEAEAPAPALGGTLRQFDAPGNAQAGQAVSAASIAPQGDREETERALRAALATLQRMSGAA